MNFINVILSNSKLMQAKIYKAASKAAENPSIGIAVNNPAALQVIKDCATITMKCLPLYVFADYKDPFRDLSGKFTKNDIAEFVQHSKSDVILESLLTLIVAKTKEKMPEIFKQVKVSENANASNQTDDPYGDYYAEKITVETKDRSIEEVLQEAFKC
jgi:hypothetical protein